MGLFCPWRCAVSFSPKPRIAMNFPSKEQALIFQIYDDAECVQIARKNGIDTDLLRLRLLECYYRTKEPQCGFVILDHTPEVLVLQYFCGHDEERHNGWQILGFTDVGVFLSYMPAIMDFLFGDSDDINCQPLVPNN